MFFQIENTPERKGCSAATEELSVLNLIPFSPQPVITFHDVPVGETATRTLYISNPKPQSCQVSIQKRSDDFIVDLSWCENTILPNQTVPLLISWRPQGIISGRTTIHVSDKKNKGKYDVSILCKSKGKDAVKRNGKKIVRNKLKRSPLKPPKQKSPKAIVSAFSKTENRKESKRTIKHTLENDIMIFHKSPLFPPKGQQKNISYNYSDVMENYDVRRETYLVQNNRNFNKENLLYHNTPNKENNGFNPLSAIENLEFTPLKSKNANKRFPIKNNRNDDLYKNNENEMALKDEYIPTINLVDTFHSNSSDVIEIKESSNEVHLSHEIYRFSHLKIPSPYYLLHDSHLNKSNDNMFKTPHTKYTNLSNDSICDFDPKRCSTEKKMDPQLMLNNSYTKCDATINLSNKRMSSETYTKGDSPIVPLDPENNEYFHSSPYSRSMSPRNLMVDYVLKNPNLTMDINTVNYNERANLRNTFREKNNYTNARDIIEANLWQTSPRRLSPTPLSSIPEEQSEICSETFTLKKKPYFETFVLNQTFEKNKSINKPVKVGWSKVANRETKQSDPSKSDKVLNSSMFVKPHQTTMITTKQIYEVDVYSMASIVDPFMASTCLYDEEAFRKLEIEFMRWLNYLLTPPVELDTKLEIDFCKAWMESRCKSVPAAPTKEQISLGYTSRRLESLRKSATALITSTQMTQIFSKVSSQVERKILSIRNDKNLHLDIGLQKIISGLLLCYNPLWLRIGLEAVYGKVVPLSSNNDICGLSEFIVENMFKDPYISSKYTILQPSYSENIKKFTLKKFLFLVYFLDQAKEKKLIFHDPCLFCRNAVYKESKQILFQFTKELLSGVGDITKHLKPLGYEVHHQQKYIHEFKYAVHNLAVDLKDGVRLTRLMEIILMRDDLLQQMRTPAISRLQKIHNVQVALSALASANFVIHGEITAKDIADGHREKTLSLLWQLINKFQAPLFENAAIIIQKWWRRRYLKVVIMNRIKRKRQAMFDLKATVIQSWWRSILCRKNVRVKLERETNASIVIQKWWRKTQCQHNFKTIKRAAVCLQRNYRSYLQICHAKLELDMLRNNKAALKIQNWYKKCKLVKHFNSTNEDRLSFLLRKSSAVKIQSWYRKIKLNSHFKATNQDFIQFMQYKSSAALIQRWYRKVTVYHQLKRENNDRPLFLLKKSSAIKIQNWYKKIKMDKYFQSNNPDRDTFLLQRSSALKIQSWYRKIKLLRYLESQNTDRPFYLQCKSSALIIQKWYRKIKSNQYFQAHNKDREFFLSQKTSALLIQQWYRKQMIYRELKENNMDRPLFLLKRSSAIQIQRWYRKIKEYYFLKSQNLDHPKFLLMKSSSITIQRWYRKIKIYQQLKLQNIDRPKFLIQKSSAILIQQWYRRMKLYHLLKSQNFERSLFLEKKHSIIKIQTWYRRIKLRQYLKSINMDRPQFLLQKSSASKIKQWYKRIKLNESMKLQNKDRPLFLLQRSSAIKIQKWYRNKMIVRELERNNVDRPLFLLQKSSAKKLQRWYRKMKMRQYLKSINEDRPQFLAMKSSTLKIQVWYRKIKMNQKRQLENIDRPLFLSMKSSALKIQNWYRMIKLRQSLASKNTDRPQFLLKKSSASKIKQWYKRIKLNESMKLQNTDRALFLMQRSSAIKIQKWYRNKMIVRELERNNVDRPLFLLQKSSAKKLQRWYRKMKMRQYLKSINEDRPQFLAMKSSTLKIQVWYRKIKMNQKLQLENIDRPLLLSMKSSALKIQNWYRMIKLRQSLASKNTDRHQFLLKKSSAIKIQMWYRKCKRIQSNVDRLQFLQLKSSTIVIQRWYRKIQMNLYLERQNSERQKALRAQQLRQKEAEKENAKYSAAVKIQSYWRGYNLRKKQADDCRIKKLRDHWHNGGLLTTQETLAERNEDAFDVIGHFRDIASIVRAFKTLDFISDVYPMMYDAEQVNRICKSLIIYMDFTNRSVSSLETLRLGVSILANLARYKHTALNAFHITFVNTILNLMMKWCEKDDWLFCSLCTLLWLYAKYDQFKEEIASHLMENKRLKTLCKIRCSIIRKKKMDLHKKINQSLNTSLISSTPSRNKIKQIKYPMTEPDYGISNSAKPKYFQDATEAIDTIFATYGLPIAIIQC